MEENKYNELDKLFRSRLNREAADQGAWNNPSDQVFDQAMSEIDNRNNRWFPFWWFLMGIGVLLLLGVVYWQFTTLTALKEEVAELKTEVQHPITSDTNADVKRLSDIEKGQQVAGKTKELSQSGKTDESDGQFGEDSDPFGKSKADKVTLKSGTGQQLDKPLVLTELPPMDKMTLPQTTENLRSEKLDRLAILPVSTGMVNTDEEKQPLQMVPDISLKEGKPAITPFVWVASEFSSFQMNNLPQTEFSLTKYDGYYAGFAVGVGLNQTLHKRWGLEYQLGFHQQYNQSQFECETPYDKNNEIVLPGGDMGYSMPVDIVTPVGLTSRGIVINLGSSDIDDNAVLLNRTKITQQFSSVSLGIVPYYTFLSEYPLTIQAGVGPRIHYLTDFDEEMDFALMQDASIITADEFTGNSPSTLNHWYGGLYGQLRLEYQLNAPVSIGLMAGYYKSLTSMKSHQGNNPARTFLNSISLGLTLRAQL